MSYPKKGLYIVAIKEKRNGVPYSPDIFVIADWHDVLDAFRVAKENISDEFNIVSVHRFAIQQTENLFSGVTA